MALADVQASMPNRVPEAACSSMLAHAKNSRAMETILCGDYSIWRQDCLRILIHESLPSHPMNSKAKVVITEGTFNFIGRLNLLETMDMLVDLGCAFLPWFDSNLCRGTCSSDGHRLTITLPVGSFHTQSHTVATCVGWVGYPSGPGSHHGCCRKARRRWFTECILSRGICCMNYWYIACKCLLVFIFCDVVAHDMAVNVYNVSQWPWQKVSSRTYTLCVCPTAIIFFKHRLVFICLKVPSFSSVEASLMETVSRQDTLDLIHTCALQTMAIKENTACGFQHFCCCHLKQTIGNPSTTGDKENRLSQSWTGEMMLTLCSAWWMRGATTKDFKSLRSLWHLWLWTPMKFER